MWVLSVQSEDKEEEGKGNKMPFSMCVCVCGGGGGGRSGVSCTMHHQRASSNSTAQLEQGQFDHFRAQRPTQRSRLVTPRQQ